MSMSITEIKSLVTPKLRGTTLARVSGFYDKCREAGNRVLARTYPLETIRSSRIENAIYSHIYHYTSPQDVRGNKGVLDIYPVAQRGVYDELEGRFAREFDIRKERDTFAIEVVNGIKTLRLSKRVNQHITIAELDSTSGVTAIGDASNIDANTYDYVTGIASVEFDLSGATGSGGIAIALESVIDLTEQQDIAALFNWIKFTDVSRLTSVTLKWGSDNANYYSKAVTTPHDLSAFVSGAYTLQRFDWSSASTTGTPDVENIDYIEVLFTYSTGAAILKNKVDAITIATGRPYMIKYYSNYFFKSAAGVYKQTPTADDDTINIGGEGENIFLYELMLVLIQELGQDSVDQNAEFFETQLNGYGEVEGLYSLYNTNYPAQEIVPSMSYYDFNFRNGDDEDDD